MAEIGSAYIAILPSTQGFQGRLQNQIGGPAGAAGTSAGAAAGGGFVGGFGGSLGGMAAVVGGIGLGSMLSGFVSDAQEAARLTAITTQAIETTGGAAKVTATQVTDLAEAISLKTGMDDAAIQGASNLLLTFTNVRNEVGKGNDIFNQATATAADMAAALGGDAASQATMLGKALNDPIAGVGALSRVGVQFTEQQKAQIDTLVASGDTLGAQKVILEELGRQYGGAAEAAANPMDKLKNAVGEVGESIGAALLPAITAFAGFAITYLVPALEKTVAVFGTVFGFIDEHKTVFTIIAGIITAVFLPALVAMAATATVSAATTVAAWVSQGFAAASASISTGIAFATNIAGWIASGIAALAGAAQIALAWLIAAGPAILIIAAIAAVIAIGVLLYKNWDTVKAKATQLKDWVVGKFKALGDGVVGIWDKGKAAFKGFINFIIRGLNRLNFTVPSVDTKLPGIGRIGGFKIGISGIPELAEGGIIGRPTLVLAGEAGPEAIVPLNRYNPTPAPAAAAAGPPDVRVFIGSRELTDIVRVEVVEHDAEAGRQLAYGRTG